mgnify:CR=1 FL=1
MSTNTMPLRSRFLPKSYFLDLLHREKYRSDRWNTPLSIAMFRRHREEENDSTNLMESFSKFFYPLENGIRETDALAYLGEDLIALLLPDTDNEGMKTLIKKVVNGHTKLPFTVATGTYPDQIFQQILVGNQPSKNALDLSSDQLLESDPVGYPLKRTLDIVGATIALLLFSPIILLTALAVKITSPGPIIFKQDRLGQKGRTFSFYKFRSMKNNNDNQIHREYVTQLIQGDLAKINQGDSEKPLYKMKTDPRVTWVGRIIRKTSIDELPQLFNVLKGEMSLVGPRPPLRYEADHYQSWHLRRILDAKPGITGLWQVEGRSRTTFDEMVRLDIRYMRNCSLSLDLKILLKTFKVVLQCDGVG